MKILNVTQRFDKSIVDVECDERYGQLSQIQFEQATDDVNVVVLEFGKIYIVSCLNETIFFFNTVTL